ncbi:Pimeloyl-ACP methyl ester carboxylesterase [Monaibacterium marinum]|uniref:Pimeloyl-ACP methyl ester carboxylesterase n=1 Tax=Pontivivens marinum TaxID=1690039 RepID=A0A2C9CN13_9RHOB|nr:alpha/beta hydrolase [Monaibacterium marinum]SOH92612.1 Pimeloyl-ACP methyl ester carboxylesterase [Monaibacterium marinum]
MSSFTSSDGLNIAFDDQGQGVPVLCLAGLTRSMSDFEPFLAARCGAVRIIRMDLRGRGASDHDPKPLEGYTVPVEGRDVIELLNHLGIEKAVIVGTSRGGIIAMLIAAMAKDRLAGVLLNDVGPKIEQSGLDVIMDYLGKRPAAKTYDQAAAGLARLNARSFPDIDAAAWRVWAQRWYIEDEDGLSLRYDPALRDAVAAGGPAPDLWPFFDALQGVPLAALRGANSELLSVETFAAMQAARPDMIAATVPNRAHVPFLDESESLDTFDKLMETIR